MEVICTNDKYSAENLAFWELHGVSHPIEDKIYTIREVIKHSDGNTGFRLEEINNPEVPINHPVIGVMMYEPTFSANRFARLSGEPLTKSEVEEIANALKEFSKL
jgi:hypothetical protein